MSGFDIPPIGGFDLAGLQRSLLQSMAQQGPLGAQSPTVQGQETARRAVAGGDAPLVGGAGGGFGGMLADSLERVQALQDDARIKTRGMALGDDVELHDVMIAANKSETAFNLLLEVRNKLVEAWDKLSRSVT